jgi:hypothetical protein
MLATETASLGPHCQNRLLQLTLAALAAYDPRQREERRADVFSFFSSLEEELCRTGLGHGAARAQTDRLLDRAVEEAANLLTDISKIAGHYTT